MCSPTCGIEYSKQQAEKNKKTKQREINKRKRNKRKDHPEVYYKENKKQLQDLLQHIARLIDKDIPCIDCGRTEAHRWDGGHYVSKGSNKAISLNLHNIFKQNGWCNNQGNASKEDFINGIADMYGKEYADMVDGLELQYPYK